MNKTHKTYISHSHKKDTAHKEQCLFFFYSLYYIPFKSHIQYDLVTPSHIFLNLKEQMFSLSVYSVYTKCIVIFRRG